MADIENLSIKRAIRAQDNRLVTPLDVMLDAASEIKSGVQNPNKAFVILLKDDDECFNWQTYRSNIKTSEAIALLDIVKAQLLSRMRHE